MLVFGTVMWKLTQITTALQDEYRPTITSSNSPETKFVLPKEISYLKERADHTHSRERCTARVYETLAMEEVMTGGEGGVWETP